MNNQVIRIMKLCLASLLVASQISVSFAVTQSVGEENSKFNQIVVPIPARNETLDTSTKGEHLSYFQGNSSVVQHIDAERIYPDVEWENANDLGEKYSEMLKDIYANGYLSKTAYDKFEKMILDYDEMAHYSNQFQFEQGEIYERTRDHYDEHSSPAGYKFYEGGERINVRYTMEYIRAAIELVSYGILNENDHLLDLNAIPTKTDGIVMAVKLAGGEKEALNSNYDSPYIDVPEYAEKYIDYAFRYKLIDDVPIGTIWDNSELTFDEAAVMLAKVYGYKVAAQQSDGVTTIDMAYARLPNVGYRSGMEYVLASGKNRLKEGEHLSNGDLISWGNSMLYKFPYRGKTRLIDLLLNKGVIDKDLKRYMDFQKYYADVGVIGRVEVFPIVNDLAKLLKIYEYEFPYLRSDIRPNIKYHVGDEFSKLNGVVYMSTYYYSKDEIYNTAKQLLIDYGLPEKDSENFVLRVMTKQPGQIQNVVYAGRDFVIVGRFVDYNNSLTLTFGEKDEEETIFDEDGNLIETRNFQSVNKGEVANAYKYDMVSEPEVRPGVYDVIGDNRKLFPGEGRQPKEYVEIAQAVSAPKMIISNKFYDGQNLEMQLFNDKDIAVKISISDQGEWGNAGIIFNVSAPTYGTNNYYGYYAGVNLDKQMFVIGKAANSWTLISENKLPKRIYYGDKFTLKIERRGSLTKFYIDGMLVNSFTDSTYTNYGYWGSRAYYGVRAYDAKTQVYRTYGKDY